MTNVVQRPRRKGLSWASRCEITALVRMAAWIALGGIVFLVYTRLRAHAVPEAEAEVQAEGVL